MHSYSNSSNHTQIKSWSQPVLTNSTKYESGLESSWNLGWSGSNPPNPHTVRAPRRASRDGALDDAELHFLEACFYRRPDGSAAASGARRGAGRSGDTFYRCRARDERRAGAGRDVFPCRFRVTDERGVECPLCGGRTTVEVKCAPSAKAGDDDEGSSARKPDAATSYAIMDDLAVRPVDAGLSGAALLSALGVAADPDDVREETVPFGCKEGLSLLWAAMNSKTALTDVFLPTVTPAVRRRRRH